MNSTQHDKSDLSRMITCWKIGPCIAGGNVLIIKTAELSPLYGIKLAQLVKEAGFPPGVINIVTGLGSVAGQALSEHMDVKKIAFTGSGGVGRQILIASAKTNLKKVTLELGGKGASIIFDDADLENAVFWATIGITAHNGQICAAGSRLYVQQGIYDKFVDAFKEASSKAVAGDPLLSTSSKGPLISKTQHSKVLGHIQNGLAAGATLLHGGKEIESQPEGNYLENTAFVNVDEDMSIMKEEIFGPVAVSGQMMLDIFFPLLIHHKKSIAKFTTEREAITRANASVYGLSNAIFTNDVSRAHRVSQALEVGQVTVNTWGALNANTPFGGVKQSGFGRDMGEDALEAWTNIKTVKFNVLPEKA
jgi:aldehyde dehydrogenase (NAD+)